MLQAVATATTSCSLFRFFFLPDSGMGLAFFSFFSFCISITSIADSSSISLSFSPSLPFFFLSFFFFFESALSSGAEIPLSLIIEATSFRIDSISAAGISFTGGGISSETSVVSSFEDLSFRFFFLIGGSEVIVDDC
jgi:hypothetical protein